MGVVYHTHYLDWFEAGRTEALRELGLAYRELEAGGVSMPVVEASIRYHGAARYDDLVLVETILHPPAGARVETEYSVSVEGVERPIVTGRVTLAFLDAARRRPIAAPAHIVALFEAAEPAP
jgi:acyl-CoA thioester hydrolase